MLFLSKTALGAAVACSVSVGLALTISSCSRGPGLSEAALRGRVVFFKTGEGAEKCAHCHGLKFENTKSLPGMGELDERRPSVDKVKNAVINGVGVMKSHADRLTPEQIDDVAAYVSEVAGRAR